MQKNLHNAISAATSTATTTIAKANLYQKRGMFWYLQILSTKSADSTPSILVHFDNRRYLFGCGEGFQRHCSQHHVKLVSISDVFLGRLKWDTIGGLPGLLLTLSDNPSTTIAAPHKMTIHGPKNTTHLLNAFRHFIPPRDNLRLETREIDTFSTDGYSDENLTVKSIALLAEGCTDFKVKEQDTLLEKQVFARLFPASKPQESKQKPPQKRQKTSPLSDVSTSTPPSSNNRTKSAVGNVADLNLPDTRPVNMSICYIGTGPEIKRKFNNSLATALKIPFGLVRSKLVNGESITLEDGRIIEPDDVCSKPEPGISFAIINVPTIAYLPSLLANSSKISSTSIQRLKCVVHVVGKDVHDSTTYREWMRQSFDSEVQQILLLDGAGSEKEEQVGEITYTDAYSHTLQCNALDRDLFPLPFSSKINDGVLDGNVVVGTKMLKYGMQPLPCKLEHVISPKSNPPSHSNAEPPESRSNAELPDVNNPLITFLGTGSMVPSKYRNVSSLLIQSKTANVIMDCGESTYAQLLRFKGSEGTRDILKDLRVIYVSHLHADHHLGLLTLIEQWLKNNQQEQQLFVMAPTRMMNYIEEAAQVMDTLQLDKLLFIDNLDLTKGVKWPLPNTNLSFSTALVDHCPQAYAVAVEYEDKRRIVYSGDTRPCNAVINLCLDREGSATKCKTTLIHECTYEDAYKQEARERRHSTVSEALNVAEKAKAEELLLTHFSQRYPTTLVLGGNGQNQKQQKLKVGMAVDGLQISTGQVDKLSRLLPQLMQLMMAQESAKE